MKTLLKLCPVSGSLLLTVALLLCLPGCGKGGREPSPQSAPAFESAEPTSFYEVTARLDSGGSLYGYLGTEQWLRGLSTKVEGWRGAVVGLPGMASGEREEVSRAFDLLTQLIDNCGVEKISGIGLSGIALEPGLYQTKIFAHHYPGENQGYLWTIAGTKPRPLDELDWLPADTVWAVFGSADLAMVWEILNRELEDAGLAKVLAGLAGMEEQIEKTTGSDLTTLLQTLGGEQGMVFTLSSSRSIRIPMPGGDPLEFPEPALLMAIKVRDDTLFDLIDRLLERNPRVIRTEENNLRMRSIPVPAPVPITLLPTIARCESYLFLASNDEIVRSVVGVHTGEAEGLKSSPEFARLAKGMPTEGNQLTFVSERLGRVLKEVQQRALTSVVESSPSDEVPIRLIRKLYASGPVLSSYAIGSIYEDGWLWVSHGNKEPASVVLAPMVIAPAAIAGAVAMPAFAKARHRAQSISCVNNLKLIEVAFHIWAADHNDTMPPDFIAAKNELVTPRILFCPADKTAPELKSLTWENLNPDSISYELVSPGVSMTDAGIETNVLVRCPIHGHSCFGDGHIERGDVAGPR